MRRPLLLFACILLYAIPVHAQLLPFSSPQEYAESMDKEQLIALYYQQCRASNKSASLVKYNDWQCACSAAKISQFMDRDALVKYFTAKTKTSLERGRAMYLGYIPCLETTVRNIIADTCPESPAMCRCLAEDSGRYVYESGDNIIPGFVRGVYFPDKAPADPLGYLLGSADFMRESGNIRRVCAYKLRVN